MPARMRVTESRAEHAEDLEDAFRRAASDGVICRREIVTLAELIRRNTGNWGKQATEMAFLAAFIGGGVDAMDNPDSRAARLAPLAMAAD